MRYSVLRDATCTQQQKRILHLYCARKGDMVQKQAANSAQAVWLNAFATPVLSGSAVASVTFWAIAASCLVCSVSVSRSQFAEQLATCQRGHLNPT
jgi:hypothetical protein